MPKLKQPATLEQLAVECLGRTVIQKAVEGTDTTALREYLYGELPDVLSQEVAAHMVPEVLYEVAMTNVSDDTEKVVAVICQGIRVLDLSNVPWFVVESLSSYIQTFSNLHTLILPDDLETVVKGLSYLKHLVHFRMQSECTDDIIYVIATRCYATIQHIDVNYSKQVTDGIFEILLECRKLRHISICGTSVTAEGFLQFLKHKKADDAAEGLLGLGIGAGSGWYVSSTLLSETARCCPKLKQLQIDGLRGDMEALVGLTELEALTVDDCDFNECNFEGFLRARGRDITSLELDCTESIDLSCIMTHCVNIRKLYLFDGMVDRPLEKLSACQSLQTLRLCWEFSSSSVIEDMLYACVNVTSLYLKAYPQEITDDLILRVLSKNPLQKLTSFIARSTRLTIRSLNAVIEHCPLLEQVSVCRIADEELKILRHKIKETNQDLRIN